jgi:hypothetical protein
MSIRSHISIKYFSIDSLVIANVPGVTVFLPDVVGVFALQVQEPELAFPIAAIGNITALNPELGADRPPVIFGGAVTSLDDVVSFHNRDDRRSPADYDSRVAINYAQGLALDPIDKVRQVPPAPGRFVKPELKAVAGAELGGGQESRSHTYQLAAAVPELAGRIAGTKDPEICKLALESGDKPFRDPAEVQVVINPNGRAGIILQG